MTALRKRSVASYHAFLVEPTNGFCPDNWRKKPDSYRIIEYVGPKTRLGSIDAWRFMHNQQAIAEGTVENGWAIYVK